MALSRGTAGWKLPAPCQGHWRSSAERGQLCPVESVSVADTLTCFMGSNSCCHQPRFLISGSFVSLKAPDTCDGLQSVWCGTDIGALSKPSALAPGPGPGFPTPSIILSWKCGSGPFETRRSLLQTYFGLPAYLFLLPSYLETENSQTRAWEAGCSRDSQVQLPTVASAFAVEVMLWGSVWGLPYMWVDGRTA